MPSRRTFMQVGALITLATSASHRLFSMGSPRGQTPVMFGGTSADELQAALDQLGPHGGVIQFDQPRIILCHARESRIGDEVSRHGLLIPEGVKLDLQGGTLRLDLRANGYGVRLSSHSGICNGKIEVIHSEGKGLQACWHSAISVGAAYGEGGTPERPGKFTKVSHWRIEKMTIDQQVEASAIQLMSEACDGVIRDVTILDSPRALLGIGMDWGSVGPLTSEDAELPRMQELWLKNQIYSTHPHDITIENVKIGKLTRNIDANDAGIRCSACHRITIRNVDIDSAASAIAIWGGDCGYEFANPDLRPVANSGYTIENVSIKDASRFGLVLNGTADNIIRAQRNHAYRPLIDPARPGLSQPIMRNIQLHSHGELDTQGIYAVAVSGAVLDDFEITGFKTGIHVEDWVDGMRFRRCRLQNNKLNTRIEGATEPAREVTFDPPVS